MQSHVTVPSHHRLCTVVSPSGALGFVLQRLRDRLAIRETVGNRLADSIMAMMQGVLDIRRRTK